MSGVGWAGMPGPGGRRWPGWVVCLAPVARASRFGATCRARLGRVGGWPLDNAIGVQARSFIVVESEQLAVDLVVVLAQAWSDEAHLARRARKAGLNRGHGYRADVRVLGVNDVAASQVLRIGKDVRDGVDRAHRHTRGVQDALGFLGRVLPEPAGYGRVDVVGVGGALRIAGEP